MKKNIVFLTAILAGLCVLGACDGGDDISISSSNNWVDSIDLGEDWIPSSDRQDVPMNMYNPSVDSGFGLDNKVEQTAFGSTAYTSLAICTSTGEFDVATYNGITAYGVVATDVSLSLTINNEAALWESIGGGEWHLSNDDWGEDTNETINGVYAGRVDSGALVIQTSFDGLTWSNENKAQYADGLYTTDYYTHYGVNETTIFTPSGDDIRKGIYIRVLYAYEIYDEVPCVHPKKALGFLWETDKYEHECDYEYQNYIEEYTFYLCVNTPEAVTFHNLSLGDQIEENLKDQDAYLVDLAKQTETLTNESVTVTGFAVDNFIKNSDKIPDSLSQAVKKAYPDEEVVDALTKMSPSSLKKVLENGGALHENLDGTVTYMPKEVHKLSHMGGAALEQWAKQHVSKFYFEIFVSAAANGAVVGGINGQDN